MPKDAILAVDRPTTCHVCAQKRLQKLQAKADSLSAGKLLRIKNKDGEWKQPQASHNDLDWFKRNS